jgi:hypothetical protein
MPNFYTVLSGKRVKKPGFWPHEVKNARTKGFFVARNGFCPHEREKRPHETLFRRTKAILAARSRLSPHETENGRTKPEISRTKRFFSARSGFSVHGAVLTGWPAGRLVSALNRDGLRLLCARGQ